MTYYVLGVVLDLERNKAWLIEKRRPEWQCGKLNGIGGHVEPGEAPLAAMQRECYEESGYDTGDWVNVGVLEGNNFVINVYYTLVNPEVKLRTATDENIHLVDMYKVMTIGSRGVEHLPLCLGLCLAHIQTGGAVDAHITFSDFYPHNG